MRTGRNRLNAAMGILLPDDGGPAGDGGTGGPGGTPPAPKPTPTPPAAPERKYTDADLNAVGAREKDQARRATLNEVSSMLGCTVEEAAEILKAHREQEQAKLTEAERAQQAANEARAQAEADRQAAAQERHEARLERALARAGVSDKPAKDGAPSPAQRAIRLLEVEVGADADAITAAIETLRADMPGLFGAPTSPAPASDPGNPPAPRRDSSVPFGAKGVEEAKRRGLIKDSATV